MSFETKEKATAEAKKLQKILGKGWELRVFRNLGWHAGCVFNETIEVSIHNYCGAISYHAAQYGGTLSMFYPDGRTTQKDPIKALSVFVNGYKRNFKRFAKEQESLVKKMVEAKESVKSS